MCSMNWRAVITDAASDPDPSPDLWPDPIGLSSESRLRLRNSGADLDLSIKLSNGLIVEPASSWLFVAKLLADCALVVIVLKNG